jgi:multicomponent Na+:H+ antiporter subunit E
VGAAQVRTKIFSLLFFASIWLALTGMPSDLWSILLVVVIPSLTLLLALKLSLIADKFPLKFSAFYYAIWLLREIILSTITVIKISWQRNLKIHPVMRPVQSIQTSDIGMVIYANSITLTPGTVTLSTYDNTMMIHALDIGLMEDLEEGKMDKMVKEIVK